MRANNPTDSSDDSAVDSVDPVSIVDASLQRALNEDHYSESDGAEANLPQCVRVNPAEQAFTLSELVEEGISYYVLNEEERQQRDLQFRRELHPEAATSARRAAAEMRARKRADASASAELKRT